MEPHVIDALRAHGAYEVGDGSVELYHATRAEAVNTIFRSGVLLPSHDDFGAEHPTDQPAQGGVVFLSTSPRIAHDLGGDLWVVPVRLGKVDVQAEVTREGWPPDGTDSVDFPIPKRAEIRVQLPPGQSLQISNGKAQGQAFDRSSVSPDLQAAIAMFEESPVGQQLRDPAIQSNNCWRGARRFLSALRESGLNGVILEWQFSGGRHQSVLVDGDHVIVDWTLTQFDEVTQAGSPHIADLRWYYEQMGPAWVKVDGANAWFRTDRLQQNHPVPWADARLPIPTDDDQLAGLHY